MIYSGKDIFVDFSQRVPPPWDYDAVAFDQWGKRHFETQVCPRETDREERYSATVRFLTETDFPALEKLHHKVVAALPKAEIFRADTSDFLKAHFSRRGRTVGTFLGDRLVGYAVVSFPLNDHDNLGDLVRLAPEDKKRVAHFDGAAVDPAFRGSELHRFMNNIRGQCAVLAGYHHLMGTVSPSNPYSLHNHLSAGFEVVGFEQKYGGVDRLIIYRNATMTVPETDNWDEQVALSDREILKKRVKQGLVGTKLEKTGNGYILFLRNGNSFS